MPCDPILPGSMWCCGASVDHAVTDQQRCVFSSAHQGKSAATDNPFATTGGRQANLLLHAVARIYVNLTGAEGRGVAHYGKGSEVLGFERRHFVNAASPQHIPGCGTGCWVRTQAGTLQRFEQLARDVFMAGDLTTLFYLPCKAIVLAITILLA
ncbi:hypothetical protein HaLaN_06964, partial [Haematococcus lacustris]